MNIAKSLFVALLILLVTDGALLSSVAVCSLNEVRIQGDKIVWTYMAQSMYGKESQRQLSRNVTIAYNQVQYTAKDRLARSNEAISTNITLVFMGYERIYFRFVHVCPNVTIALDSNIIIDENEIVVQWFSVKTRRKMAIGEGHTVNHVQLNKHIAEVLRALNVSMIKSYSAYMLEIPMKSESEFIEAINIYDIVIDKEQYVHSLRELGIQNNNCGDFNEMPAYAWIETDTRIEGDEKRVVASITGLSSSSMHSGIIMSSCTLPMLNKLIEVIESLNLSTYYAKAIKEYNVNVKETIMHYYRAYAENATYYIELFEELMGRVPKDRSIKIEYNAIADALHLRVTIEGITENNIDLQEVRNMLLKTLEAFSVATGVEGLNWQIILDNAHISYGIESGFKGDEAMSALTAWRTIIITYVLVTVQVAVIAIAILSVLKPRSASPKSR